tara:strand:+ start:666 stop:1826 length:1161 start_codon:yes stop_codon:yes gene_type:complete
MPTINQLPTITTLSGGDQLPVYATSNGDARKASITTLVEYFQTTFADPNYTVIINAPTNSGFNIALAASSQSIWLIMNPTGTFAAGSVTLPPVADCYDGQEIIMISTQTISALTINGNGGTLVGVPLSLGAGSSFTIRFNELQSTWYTIVNSLQIDGIDVVTTTGVQTLTNKTMSFSNNTFSATSAELITALSDNTGIGLSVFNTSPTLVTPLLGTPTSGTLTNCTGLPTTGLTGLGTGVATFLATPSSANLSSALTDETGTGLAVFNVNPTIDGANFTGHAQTAPVVAASTGGTLTIDCSGSNVFTVTMNEDVTTLDLTSPAQGQTVNILLTQDSTGSRLMTWPASFKWAGGTASILSTNANAEDLLVITYLGTSWYASLVKDMQ